MSFYSSLSAQLDNYEKARIITSTGETINCEVSLEGEAFMSKKIKCKINGEIVNKTPSVVKAVYFEESKLLYRSVLHEYKDVDSGESIEVERFASVLVNGDMTVMKVFEFPDEYEKRLSTAPNHVYYVEKEGETYPLKVIVEYTSQRSYNLREQYKGGFKFLLQDCPDALKKVDGMKFTDKYFIAVANTYNNSCGGKQADSAPSETMEFEILEENRKELKSRFGLKVFRPIFSLQENSELDGGIGFGVFLAIKNRAWSSAIEIEIGLNYLKHTIIRQEFRERGAGRSFQQTLNSTQYRLPIIFNLLLADQSAFKPKLKFMVAGNIVGTDGTRFFAMANQPGEPIVFFDRGTRVDNNVVSPTLGVGTGIEYNGAELNLMLEYDPLIILPSQGKEVENRLLVMAGVSYRF
jgi:hypothetical protein